MADSPADDTALPQQPDAEPAVDAAADGAAAGDGVSADTVHAIAEVTTVDVDAAVPPATAPADTAAEAASASSLDAPAATHVRAIVYCAACFFVLFSAWSPAQSFVTTSHPSFGPYSIILIYAFLGLFGLLAPSIINTLGVRTSFVASASAYGLFMCAEAIEGSAVPLAIASCLVGAGGGVLWVNQGLFIKGVATEAGGHVGYLTGLWFSVYSLAPMVGNGVSGALLSAGLSLNAVLLILAAVAGVATLMLAGVRNAPVDPRTIAPLKQKLRETKDIMRERAMQALMLWMAAQGLAQSFQFTVFPTLVNAAGEGHQHVSFIFVVYGCTSVTVSYVSGRGLDRYGWRWITVPFMVDLCVGYALCALGGLLLPTLVDDGSGTDTSVLASGQSGTHALTCFYVCGFLFGISDGLVQVLLNATVVMWYGGNRSPAAFATYRVTGSATWVLGVLIRLATNAAGAGVATVALSFLAFGNFWIYQTKIRPNEIAVAELNAQQQQTDAAAAAEAASPQQEVFVSDTASASVASADTEMADPPQPQSQA